MKKSLAALAALMVCGAASAQSSVTLFGVVDAAVRNVTNKSDSVGPFNNGGSVKASRTELANSGLSSSRLGFRGTEDLGGGLAAGFWLEAPISNDDGAAGGLSFSRRSTVSLSHAKVGELRLGRDTVPHASNDSQFDPFGDTGIGGSLIVDANESGNIANKSGTGFGSNKTYKRASNMVQYFLPSGLGGVYGSLAYALHENTSQSPNEVGVETSSTGRYVGGRLGYAAGAFDVALGYGESRTEYGGLAGKVNTFNLGATYDFGVVKLFGEYSQSKDKRDWQGFALATPNVELKGYLVGISAPVGAGVIRASYAQVKYDYNRVSDPFSLAHVADPKANKLAIGYQHNLSKRTALYGTIARVSNKNGAGLTVGAGPSYPAKFQNLALAPKSSTGYEFGIRHSF